MNTHQKLLAKYPGIRVIEVDQVLDQATFDVQKAKHASREIEGGAIGTVWLDNETLVLTKRSGLHAGWALIGGTVEKDEAFDDAFLREVEEETGIKASIRRVILLERKTFISPAGERLRMDVALIEAVALDGQKIIKTSEANREGLVVEAFSKNGIPNEMILKDREKLRLLINAPLTQSQQVSICVRLLEMYDVDQDINLGDIKNFKAQKSQLYGHTNIYSFDYRGKRYHVSDDYSLGDILKYIQDVFEDAIPNLQGEPLKSPVPQSDGAVYASGLDGVEYYLWRED